MNEVRVSRWVWLLLVVTALVCLVDAALEGRRKAHAASGDPGFPTGGQIMAVGYNKDRQTGRFRPGLTTADSNSLATTLAAAQAATPSQLVVTNGRPTIAVSCRFSTSSTNTCKVRVAWLYTPDNITFYFLGLSVEQQANATAVQDQGYSGGATAGYYMAQDLFFDGHGSTHALILLTTAPTGGGTVDFWIGTE